MATFHYTLTVTVERNSGKFMSNDEIEEAIADAIESADPGSIYGGADGDSEYEVTDWDFNSVPRETKR